MPLINLGEIEEKELLPGLHVRFVHSDTMTLAYWNFEEGASLPEHTHPHEQVVNVIEGELELVVDGEPHHLTPGKVFVLSSNVPHGGKAITACKIIDVFHPVREEYR
jgi:quercetin dioxygenase-like cupin family protein